MLLGMQTTLHLPPLEPSSIEPSPVFNVIIAYEDFESGMHAKKTYDFLTANLGHDFVVNNQMWKFDVLSIPKLREMAACDAAEADIIIISSHGGSELPVPVRAWIDAWLNKECGAIALVALFDRGPEQAEGVRRYLAEVAKRAGLEFFAQPDEWPGAGGFELRASLPGGRTRADHGLSILARIETFERPSSRWGINE